MISPATALYEFLVTEIGLAGTFYVGKESGNGDSVTIYDTTGLPPSFALPSECGVTYRPSVQVRVRNKSYPAAYSLINAIRSEIIKINDYGVGSVIISNAMPLADITPLGQDANNYWILTLNFTLTVRGY